MVEAPGQISSIISAEVRGRSRREDSDVVLLHGNDVIKTRERTEMEEWNICSKPLTMQTYQSWNVTTVGHYRHAP